MEDNPLTIKEQEYYAISNYTEQRDMLSKSFVKKMNRQSLKDNLAGGLIGGTIIGVMFGAMAGQNMARVPVREENGHVVEYRFDANQFAKPLLTILSASILLSLILSGAKTISSNKQNQGIASNLSDNTYKRYFQEPLKKFSNNTSTIFQSMRAAVLIINNLPETERNRLQMLAKSGLTQDKNGKYSINDQAIETASHIISNFIQYNEEIGYNIVRIMHGEDPTTSFLTNQKQKIK